MNTKAPSAPVTIPDPKEFCKVWSAFFSTVSAIATYRANTADGRRRFGELCVNATDLLVEPTNLSELESSILSMLGDTRERLALGILFEELLFVTWKYQGAFELAGIPKPETVTSIQEPAQFSTEHGHPGDLDVISDIETVKGSIQKLLDKLPPWMRKVIDVILEALKLSRGLIH